MYLWDYLAQADKPVVLYGKGNGAEKILACCETIGVEVKAIFASDDRPSHNLFHDMPVEKLDDVLLRYPDPIILFCFGSERPEVVDMMEDLASRFESYFPDMPVSDGPLISDEFVEENRDRIQSARKLLSGYKSRRVFDNLLSYKSSGKIEYLVNSESDQKEKRKLLKLSNDEHFLDLGAYTGDTIDEFLDWKKGKYKHITAFEANDKNYNKLQENKGYLENITFINKAVWDCSEELIFSGRSGRNFGILTDIAGRKTEPFRVSAVSIDELDLDPSFVKMDIEGAERQALIGMKKALNEYHPKLQISVYHRTDDFYEIPLLLEELCPGYKMYLRHHRALPAWEYQLYCYYE